MCGKGRGLKRDIVQYIPIILPISYFYEICNWSYWTWGISFCYFKSLFWSVQVINSSAIAESKEHYFWQTALETNKQQTTSNNKLTHISFRPVKQSIIYLVLYVCIYFSVFCNLFQLITSQVFYIHNTESSN